MLRLLASKLAWVGGGAVASPGAVVRIGQEQTVDATGWIVDNACAQKTEKEKYL